MATFIYPDNLKSTIAECGRVTNEPYPGLTRRARVRCWARRKASTCNGSTTRTDPEVLDIANGRWRDVVVDTGPSYTTRRVEAAETMMEFLRTFASGPVHRRPVREGPAFGERSATV